MNWISIIILMAEKDDRSLTPTQSFGNWLLPVIILVVAVIFVYIAQYLFREYVLRRKQVSDWEELEELFARFDLSREEVHLVRSKLIKFRYAYPSKILKKEIEFEKFRKKVLKRPNHHIEFLLAVVYKKVFETKGKRIKKAAAASGVSSSENGSESPKNIADVSSSS
ncbi:MAG: hypothetical protein AB1656_07145 [Candidatus Omnitrophota bacterium]